LRVTANGVTKDFNLDFSQFDQSQSEGPLTYELIMMKVFGVPAEVCDCLFRTAATNPRVADTRILGFAKRMIRPTGGANTTTGNGVVCIGVVVCSSIAAAVAPIGDFEEIFKTRALYLGFRATGGEVPFGTACFLKGLWWPTVEGRVWGPTPSRILKVGKSVSDLAAVYRLPLRDACARHAADVANGYATMLQVPVLRAYVAKFRDHSGHNPDPYKVKGTGRYSALELDEVAALELMRKRYGTSEGWMELENMYASATLFSFIEHPLHYVLKVQDY